jgi:hypothetical protein
MWNKIINFPNMCSNIPSSPAYGVYISQLIQNICMVTVTCTRPTLFLTPTLVYFIYKSINKYESENGNRIMATGCIHVMYVVWK